ncbi:MAG: membrane protein insertion efficiency factor YidD [Dehalococcoidia bacterium]|nr:MAG: membrane protein insertion efficiency factor YidD [Dehalococcoidia bacterium]
MKQLALALIKLYQATISQVMPSSCRFSPTCSQYAFEAIAAYGIFRGIWLGIKRLARCNPLHDGGYDPVPEKL